MAVHKDVVTMAVHKKVVAMALDNKVVNMALLHLPCLRKDCFRNAAMHILIFTV